MNLRKLAVFVMIFAAVMLAVSLYQRHQNQASAQTPTTQPTTQVATQPAASAPAASVPAAKAQSPAPAAAPVAEAGAWLSTNVDETKVVTLGSLDKTTGYRLQLELTNNGAAVYTAKLSDYFATVADKKLASKYEKEFDKYLAAVAAEPAKYHGNYSLLNPVPKGIVTAERMQADLAQGVNPLLTSQLYLPYASQSITISRPGKVAVTLDLELVRWKQLPAAQSREAESDSASFEWTLAQQVDGQTKNVLRLVKTYTVHKGKYAIDLVTKAENLSGEAISVTLNQLAAVGVPREDVRMDMRKFAYGRLDDGKVAVKLDDINNKDLDANAALPTEAGKPILWAGLTNKFFTSLMLLEPTSGNMLSGPRAGATFFAQKVAGGAGSKAFLPSVSLGSLAIQAGESATVAMNVFTGPKLRDQFENVEPYKSLNYMTVIETTGGCGFCSFSWLTLAIMWLLEFLAKSITLGNYGVAIIILVIIVRIALHPLTKKGQVSMMKMQKLAPKMAELKEKYKDDKDTLQRETMKFYKEQGASPILGCLPMLLQMPIWIALYNGLSVDVSLRQAPFLPVWITDLAGMDAIVSWATHPVYVPLLSGLMGPIVSFNLLPLLLTVAMYYQTKLTPTSMGATPTPQQAQQQKMMKWMTPIMMLLFFYNAPAGLTLYVMASTASSVVEQIVIRRHIEEQEAIAAATETTVEAPGKLARGARPKKPKGPGWMKHG